LGLGRGGEGEVWRDSGREKRGSKRRERRRTPQVKRVHDRDQIKGSPVLGGKRLKPINSP